MTTHTWTSLVRRDSKGPLSTGAIAGIAVGAAVLFLTSAALFVFYYRRQRRYNAEDNEYYQYGDSVHRGQNNTGRTFVAVPRRAPTYTMDYKMDNQGGTGQLAPAQFSAGAQTPKSPPLDDMASAMPTHPAYLPKAVVRGTTLKPIAHRPSEDTNTQGYYPQSTDGNNMPLQAYRGSSSTATAAPTGGSDPKMMGSKEKQFFPSPPGSGGTGQTTFYDDEDYYAEDPEKDVKGRRRVSLPLRLAPVDQEVEEEREDHYYQQEQEQQQQSQHYHYQQPHEYHQRYQQQQQQQQPQQQSPPALPTPASVASSSRTTRGGGGIVPTIALPKGKKKKFPPPQLNLQQQHLNNNGNRSHGGSPNNPNNQQTTGSGSNPMRTGGTTNTTGTSGSGNGNLMVDMVMSTSNHRPLSGMEDMSISGPLAFPQLHQPYPQYQQLQDSTQGQGGYYVDEYGNPIPTVPGSGGSRGGRGRGRSRSFGGDHQGYQGQGESGGGKQRHGGEGGGGRREKRNSGNNGRHYEEVEIGREDDIW